MTVRVLCFFLWLILFDSQWTRVNEKLATLSFQSGYPHECVVVAQLPKMGPIGDAADGGGASRLFQSSVWLVVLWCTHEGFERATTATYIMSLGSA